MVTTLIAGLVRALCNVWHGFIVNILFRIFTVLDHQKQLFIDPFDFLDNPLKILILDGQKGRHADHLLDPGIIVPVVIELIETIRYLLRFSKKQEAMLNLFLAISSNVTGDLFNHFLNKIIEQGQIVQIHNKQIQYLVLLNIVPAHLVK